MRRKIAKIGPATLMVSLPSKWTKQFDIKKGDEIEIQQKGGTLLLSAESTAKMQPVARKVDGMSRRYIEKLILSYYHLGYDEIKLEFSSRFVNDIRADKQIAVVSVVSNFVSDLIGFEIIAQSSSSITIRNIAHPAQEELDKIIRRIFLLIKGYLEQGFEGIKNKDYEYLNEISSQKNAITKFIHYAKRLVNISTKYDGKKQYVLHTTLMNLYRIVIPISQLNRMSIHPNHTKPSLDFFKSMLESFDLIYTMFYKPSAKNAEEFYVQHRKSRDLFKKIVKTKNEGDLLLTHSLNLISLASYVIWESVVTWNEL